MILILLRRYRHPLTMILNFLRRHRNLRRHQNCLNLQIQKTFILLEQQLSD
jgi:hypothetical protein